jgi:hypothetical protein
MRRWLQSLADGITIYRCSTPLQPPCSNNQQSEHHQATEMLRIANNYAWITEST